MPEHYPPSSSSSFSTTSAVIKLFFLTLLLRSEMCSCNVAADRAEAPHVVRQCLVYDASPNATEGAPTKVKWDGSKWNCYPLSAQCANDEPAVCPTSSACTRHLVADDDDEVSRRKRSVGGGVSDPERERLFWKAFWTRGHVSHGEPEAWTRQRRTRWGGGDGGAGKKKKRDRPK